jgi:pilus assembly protein CpaF
VPTVASAIDIVVHCELLRTGNRRIAEISATTGRTTQSAVETRSLFALRRGRLEATGEVPVKTAKFQASGADLTAILGSEP